MRILLVGGGSGGHVTPLATVAGKLTQQAPDSKLYLISDRGYFDTANKMLLAADSDVEGHQIFAGKFRRYAHRPWWWHIIHLPTLLANLRDVFYLGVGFVQSLWILHKIKPSVVFCKGGFVCLPVGVAAHHLKIPIVLHDSDSTPGLTARVLSRWARAIAVGAELDAYNYNKDITYQTGIPVSDNFKPVTAKQQSALKKSYDFTDEKPLLMIVGGGLGAENLNEIVVRQARGLLKHFQIAHFAGKGKVEQVRDILNGMIVDETKLADYHVYDFTNEMYKYIQAADIVVSRAGATAIQEIASVGKPLILVPGRQLSGGHQIKNAQMLADKAAARVLNEDDLEMNGEILVKATIELCQADEAKRLVKNIVKLKRPDAADEIAGLVLSAAKFTEVKG